MFIPIKDLIGDVTAQLGLNQRAHLQAIADTYARTVEPQVLASTRLATLRNGVLEIEVRAAPLLMELSQFRKRDILRRLREEHPHVRDLRFRASAT